MSTFQQNSKGQTPRRRTLTDAAVAVAHVAPEFPGLPQSGWHGGGRKGCNILNVLYKFINNLFPNIPGDINQLKMVKIVMRIKAVEMFFSFAFVHIPNVVLLS